LHRAELEKSLRDKIHEAQNEINALPSDPSPSDLKQYRDLIRRIQVWGEMLARFCPSPKVESIMEKEILY